MQAGQILAASGKALAFAPWLGVMCHTNFMDKLMKWKLIENELRQAHQLLPKNIKQSDFGYREEDFLEYLSHNELRLAMEELDGVIVDNPSPSKEFWQHLVNAANLMNSKKEPT